MNGKETFNRLIEEMIADVEANNIDKTQLEEYIAENWWYKIKDSLQDVLAYLATEMPNDYTEAKKFGWLIFELSEKLGWVFPPQNIIIPFDTTPIIEKAFN